MIRFAGNTIPCRIIKSKFGVKSCKRIVQYCMVKEQVKFSDAKCKTLSTVQLENYIHSQSKLTITPEEADHIVFVVSLLKMSAQSKKQTEY